MLLSSSVLSVLSVVLFAFLQIVSYTLPIFGRGCSSRFWQKVDLIRNPRVPLRFTRGYISGSPSGFRRHSLTFVGVTQLRVESRDEPGRSAPRRE